jgi:hypothetical protein
MAAARHRFVFWLSPVVASFVGRPNTEGSNFGLGAVDLEVKTSEESMNVKPDKPRVLLFSLRNIFGRALFRCAHFEFEDIICEIDSAEVLAPELNPDRPWSKFAMRTAYHAPIILNPGVRAMPVKAEYDLFFTVCGGLASPYDLLMVNAAVSKAKDKCKVSVCLVDELWIKQMRSHRHFLLVLEKFDIVMLYHSQTVKLLSERIGRKCIYLPPGIDAISFCPYPDPPRRFIDVLSIGRRSETTHKRLLTMVRDDGIFYLHDSILGNQGINAKEHRSLFANTAKRSRYFIVNPGLIDQPEKRGNQIEIGTRYFEGAASGAIMIGERPENEEFERLFDWPEAVAHLPFGSNDIDTVIKRLDRDREEQETRRRAGVVRALTQNDWVYRWEAILNAVGLKPMQGALERRERLRKLSRMVMETDQAPRKEAV